MKQADTKQIERAAQKAASARQALEDAIGVAGDAGLPLRTIADAAGMSHEKVRTILSKRKARLD